MFINDDLLLLKIIEHMPGSVYWKDAKGKYKGCNNNFPQIINLKFPTEVIGKTDYQLLDKTTADAVRAIDLRVMASGEEYTVEEEYINHHQQKIVFLSKKIPIRNRKNKICGILGISFDITERKAQEIALCDALERAEAANNAKSIFVSSVSHDMRTPLTGILGALELIKMQVTPTSKLEALFAGAKKCTDLLINMINRVMDFAQHENTGLVLHKEEVNLKQLVIDCMDMYKLAAQKKTIKLSLEYQAPETFYTDPLRVQEILLNLLGNAVKFTDSGEINMKVQGTNRSLRLSIQDTGIGIPADMHEAIFEKFTRAIRSDRSQYPGYGLGLAKVNTSIEALKGEIKLQSELGKGSTFEVYFGA